jgi:endonuclease YncB( thermonuclease family)
MPNYTMSQYDATPQHKKKMKWNFVEKTISFASVPHATAATGGKVAAWAAGDTLEVMGVRTGQIIMGVTIEVIKPTSTEVLAGHTIELLDSDDRTLATVRTDGSAYQYGISPYITQDALGSSGMPEGLFCQPFEVPSRGVLSIKINAAFTTGVIK